MLLENGDECDCEGTGDIGDICVFLMAISTPSGKADGYDWDRGHGDICVGLVLRGSVRITRPGCSGKGTSNPQEYGRHPQGAPATPASTGNQLFPKHPG